LATKEILIKENQKTVLLVDDHNYSLIVLRKMVERLGVKVISVENGQEAVRICQEVELDLVFMDIKMPVMDGYIAMKQIKKIKPELKIIAETAYALAGDRSKILDAGFDEYLPKPITKKNLDELLDKYLK
jgi:two-component system, cell cycle response regulator DivK